MQPKQKQYQLRSLFTSTLLTSCAPLLFYALISIFNENYEVGFLQILKSAIIKSYCHFLLFSLMMIVLNVIYSFASTLILKKSVSLENNSPLPTTHQKESYMTKRKTFQRMILMMFFYGIIYLSFTPLRSRLGLLNHNNNSSSTSMILKTTGPFSLNPDDPILNTIAARNLEYQEAFALTESPPQLPTISKLNTLSVGRRLGFLEINPNSILLSNNSKLAFVITRYFGGLKIVDISDPQYPNIIGSLDLFKNEFPEKFKTLKLSADEKTLFATTGEVLEIINVTNPQSPSLISPHQRLSHDGEMPFYFRPTLAPSQDGNFLYVAGCGLQIFDIKKSSRPKLAFAVTSPEGEDEFLPTSLALLPGKEILAYANNSQLEFYNVSDSTKPALLTSYSAKIDITSIELSKKDSHIIYALGFLPNSERQVFLEKINIEDLLSPQSIDLYDLQTPSSITPSIMALTPNETSIFITAAAQEEWQGSALDMIAYDLLKKQNMTQSESFFEETMAVAIIPHTNHVLAGSKQQFQVLEFLRDYPNTKAFCRFDKNNKFINFGFSVNSVHSSDDVWLVSTDGEKNIYYSFDMTNDTFPKQIASYQFPDDIIIQEISINKKRAFIQTDTNILVLNISSPKINLLGSLFPNKSSSQIEDFQISGSQDIAFVLFRGKKNNKVKISTIDFANFSSIIESLSDEISTKVPLPHIQLSRTRDLLFILLEQIHIYNISNPMAPAFIQAVNIGGESIRALHFSPDTKTLFVLTNDLSQSRALKIFDISNLTNPKLIKALTLPRIGLISESISAFILSRDMKRGFVLAEKDILVLDFRNLSSPAILGMAPYGSSEIGVIEEFSLSADEKIGYISTKGQVLKVNLDLSYTLYLPQENFLIGKKYSDSVMFLNSYKKGDFLLMNSENYKIIRLSLFNIQISPSQESPLTTYTSLPSWISFDSENQVLTVEAKRQRDLGSYTLYAVSSNKIPLEVFDPVLPKLNNSVSRNDVATLLISLGYMDNQRFLTKSFGNLEDFLLPTLYQDVVKEIYHILRSHYIETFTGFSIISSLKLFTSGRKLSINTTSFNPVKIDIKLFDTKAQFLQKVYGTMVPVITENKNRLTLEGPLDSVDKALRELVININGSESIPYQGEISINDNLNSLVSQFYENITDYFFHNDVPMLNHSHNLTVQKQIDLVSLSTGQYFSINLDPSTFKDQYSDSLTYLLVRKENNEDDTLPSWLSFQGLTLKGTPPEEIFKRQFKFELIVKNEFKQIEVPFVLNVNISWLFAGKLLMRFSPYILTAIGLIISANKIYNILAKKRYRHSKEFYVKVGEEITSSIIFPIRFIAEEKIEGDLILKHLKNKTLLTDSETEMKASIKEAVNRMSAQDRKKLKLYARGSGQKQVYQYILNEMITQQLNSSEEKATKDLFDSIQEKWVDLIEYHDYCGFTVKENNLEALLREKQDADPSRTLSDSLLLLRNYPVNLDLVKKALVVHATKNHELAYPHADLDVLINLQRPKNRLFQFFKRDLRRVMYSDKGRSTYGISYQIEKDTLEIRGTPNGSFEGKVLVVQIVTKHQRILKEMWIHGVSDLANNEERLSFRSESQDIDRGYEAL